MLSFWEACLFGFFVPKVKAFSENPQNLPVLRFSQPEPTETGSVLLNLHDLQFFPSRQYSASVADFIVVYNAMAWLPKHHSAKVDNHFYGEVEIERVGLQCREKDTTITWIKLFIIETANSIVLERTFRREEIYAKN